jgi:hypothetical protein
VLRWLLALAFVLLAALEAWGQATQVITFADVTVTGSATLVRAANANRTALACTNTSATVNIRIGDSNITSSRGMQVRAGDSVAVETTAAVYAISEGANVTLSCTETRR